MIAVCSDKGTCHVYNINAEVKTENTTSWFSSLGKVVSYFGSEWSFASYKFTSNEVVPETKCAFVSDTKLVLISIEGDYTLLEVELTNKELIMKEQKNLLEESES